MRPIIGGSDMVIANTATKAKNSKREPSAVEGKDKNRVEDEVEHTGHHHQSAWQ
ncbi:Uncharacterised protein [Vibrio cholerae]|nr:Uncharacterised protein [Vibrio cholerae]